MIGAILGQELLLAGRRGRLDGLRRVYAGWLIAQFTILFVSAVSEYEASAQPPPLGTGWPDPTLLGQFVNSYLNLFVLQHFALLALLTPASTAGAIADERTRGTLELLFTAEVSAREIVAGKWLGRVIQVAFVALAGPPLLAFMGGYGHLGPRALVAFVVLTAVVLLALAAVSLLASAVSATARDAVLRVYAWGLAGGVLVWGVREWLLGPVLRAGARAGTVPPDLLYVCGWLDAGLAALNPLAVLELAWESRDSGPVVRQLLLAVLGWGLIGGLCLVAAVRQLWRTDLRRPEHAGNERAGRRAVRVVPEGAPLAWKEREVAGRLVVPWLGRLPRWVGPAVVGGGTVWLLTSAPGGVAGARFFAGAGAAFLFAASVLVAVRSSGTVVGERERQTWDSLLLTPIETGEILRDKLWGILASMLPSLAAFAVPALVLAVYEGPEVFLPTLMAVLLVGPVMYFVGAVGIWWSVYSQGAARSLLGTLFYVYAVLLPLVGAAGAFLGFCLFLPVAVLTPPFFGPFLSFDVYVGLAGALYWAAKYHLTVAEQWLEANERTEPRRRSRLTEENLEALRREKALQERPTPPA